LLGDPSALTDAIDSQEKWIADADRILDILLEQDGENKDRERQIDRLEDYKKQLEKIVEQQQELRAASAKAAAARRMLQQLEQAIQRTNAIQAKQGALSRQSSAAQGAKSGEAAEKPAEAQEQLERETRELAEDLQRLAESGAENQPEQASKSPASEQTRAASEQATQAGAAMSKAAAQMRQGQPAPAEPHQREAEEALRRVKDRLETARKELQDPASSAKQGENQRTAAKQTRSLSDQMQQDSQSEGQSGQQGQQGQKGQKGRQGKKSKGPPPSAPQNLDKAEQHMEDAAEDLEEERPDDAAEPQEDALEQLEQVQRDLEEALLQLRKEEREEMLRDLESRFRDMLGKQKGINDKTLSLDQVGEANFRRPEHLQLAELSSQQKALAEKAATCVHILDEEGTTVAFPHMVEQIAADMDTVADRLAAFQAGSLTQSIQVEIVDALEQLLEALKKMRQENEQQGASRGGGNQANNANRPLLPPSAELKLLRSSQWRVNTRTTAIEQARSEGTESELSANENLQKVAIRQFECEEIAKQMRDRLQHE
jgi:hypothetical protein